MKWQQPTHDSLNAYLARMLDQNRGWCLRCGMPWGAVEHHTTWYSERVGCSPLCEGCWTILGAPEARIEYYKTLIDRWESHATVSEDDKRDIQRAVANGG